MDDINSNEKFACDAHLNLYSCRLCRFSSHLSLLLNQHNQEGCRNALDRHTFLQTAYKCGNCSFVSCSLLALGMHERTHLSNASHLNSTFHWQCSHCDVTVSYKLNRNMFQCDEYECNYKSSTIVELKQHSILVHLPKDCLKTFLNDTLQNSDKFLISSKQFSCEESVKPYGCMYCDFSSYVLSSLVEHKKEGCGNAVDQLNIFQTMYKCGNCAFMSCSLLVMTRHKQKCLVLHGASCSNTFYWQCSHCDFTLSHKNRNLNTNTFKCAAHNCDYKSPSIEGLKQHSVFAHLPDECLKFLFAHDGVVRKETKQFEQFSCKQCGQEFNKKTKLHKHTTYEHCQIKDGELLACNECYYKCKLKFVLYMHKLHKHTPFEEWLRCRQCSDRFKTKAALQLHRLHKHTPLKNIRWFKCPECPYQSKTKRELRWHKSNKHTASKDIEWFSCQECEYKAKSKDFLRQHRTRKHTPLNDIKWFCCQECQYKGKSKTHLHRHVRYKHTLEENIKWFECRECPYKSKTKGALLRHITCKHTPTENIKWFECHECDYKAKSNVLLRRHRNYEHTAVEDIKWFCCQECEYKCKSKGNLLQHVNRRHAPVKKIKWFECGECPYKSKRKDGLRKHACKPAASEEFKLF